jgi:membrane protein
VTEARAVLDRYNLAGGGLLAAGIAYNTLFAFVPIILFGGAVLGFLVTDPERLADIRVALTEWAPPLADAIDEILANLSDASPTLSIIGLVGILWGTTRLFASLEQGIEAMFAGAPQRGIVARTVRRIASIVVVAGILAATLVATSVASFVAELSPGGTASGIGGTAIAVALLALPIVLSTLAIVVIYEVLPPVRPGLGSSLRPAIVVGVGLVLLTRLFAILAPRLLGASFVYGTLGAFFVALTWLGLAYSLILIGAAWVRERMLAAEGTAAVA